MKLEPVPSSPATRDRAGDCGADLSDLQLSALVRRDIARRCRRLQYFPADLFADPAWDILLHLYSAQLAQRRISSVEACGNAGVPVSTGLRWLEKLSQDGLVERRCDPLDGRRIWVELTELGRLAMKSYFNVPLPPTVSVSAAAC